MTTYLPDVKEADEEVTWEAAGGHLQDEDVIREGALQDDGHVDT